MATQNDFYAFTKNWLECVANNDKLSHAACRVAIMIAMHCNSATRDARVGLAALAAETGLTEKGVRGIVQILAKRGLLGISPGGGPKITNIYSPLLPPGYVPLLKRPREERFKPSPGGEGLSEITLTRQGEQPSPGGEGNPLYEPFNPQSPQKSNGEDASSSWAAFIAVWPLKADEKWVAANRLFDGLSAVERRLAIDNAPVYLKRCADQGKEPWSHRQWLREKGWVAEAKTATSQPGTLVACDIWVPADLPEGRAWTRVWRATKGKSPPVDAKGGWRFASRWPPEGCGDCSASERPAIAIDHGPPGAAGDGPGDG